MLFQYSPPKISDFLFSLSLDKEWIAMRLCNKSEYEESGYHCFEHSFRTIGILNVIPNLDMKAKKDVALAMIWHDCGYSHPFDDKKNTEIAVSMMRIFSKQPGESLDRAEKIIRDLCFPYQGKPESEYGHIARDCDHGMILQDGYEMMYSRLLNREFASFDRETVIEKAKQYMENLSFNSPFLQSVYRENYQKIQETVNDTIERCRPASQTASCQKM